MTTLWQRLKPSLVRYLAPSDESFIVLQALAGSDGVMLDVGAHYGLSLEPFAKAGWSVHAFEPDPENRARLIHRHGSDHRVTVIAAAVGERPGTMTLYTSTESTGVSSLLSFTDDHRPTASVEVIRLRDYMARHAIRHVDFLKIDVEGYEKFVLDGCDWSIKPDAIVLEFEDSKTVPIGYDWRYLADRLKGLGYTVVVSEWYPPSKYGDEHRWRHFRRYPCDLADPHATGNLIAFRNLSYFRIWFALLRARVRFSRYALALWIRARVSELRAADHS